MAAVDWQAAVTALEAGRLPCPGGEGRILGLTAGIAGGVPVDLRFALPGLDERNIAGVARAVLHAAGHRDPRAWPESTANRCWIQPCSAIRSGYYPRLARKPVIEGLGKLDMVPMPADMAPQTEAAAARSGSSAACQPSRSVPFPDGGIADLPSRVPGHRAWSLRAGEEGEQPAVP